MDEDCILSKPINDHQHLWHVLHFGKTKNKIHWNGQRRPFRNGQWLQETRPFNHLRFFPLTNITCLDIGFNVFTHAQPILMSGQQCFHHFLHGCPNQRTSRISLNNSYHKFISLGTQNLAPLSWSNLSSNQYRWITPSFMSWTSLWYCVFFLAASWIRTTRSNFTYGKGEINLITFSWLRASATWLCLSILYFKIIFLQ